MLNLLKNHKKHLHYVGLAEGISLLLLFGLAMPLKYIFHIPEPTQVIGMLHGILFIWYVLAVVNAHLDLRWPLKTTFFALLASIFPFGTFIADAKIFKHISE